MPKSGRGRGTVADQRARQRVIRDYVLAAGSISVEDIAQHTGVSTMTVYRDLADLEPSGVLRLSRGMVTAAASNLHEASSGYRLTRESAEKASLAQAALQFVEPGSAVMLDDSSTGVHLARLLPQRAPLTVVTNYQPVAELVKEEQNIRLILTGGEYRAWADAVLGPMTVKAVRTLRADAAFMSVSALYDGRCFHPTEEPAEVKRAMMASSMFKVLYVDHTKFSRAALHEVGSVRDFDVVIVDQATTAQHVATIEDAGVRVVRAEP